MEATRSNERTRQLVDDMDRTNLNRLLSWNLFASMMRDIDRTCSTTHSLCDETAAFHVDLTMLCLKYTERAMRRSATFREDKKASTTVEEATVTGELGTNGEK